MDTVYSKNNLPKHIVKHSPTGMSWGYGGSGPADLALSLLAEVVGTAEAEKYYQYFKWEVVAGFKDGWRVSKEQIKEWYRSKKKEKSHAF